MRRTTLLLGSPLLALALVACQPKETPEQAEQNAESAVCTNLAAVGTALEAVGELSPSSTVGDALKARSNLSTALAKLDQSEEALDQLRVKELQKQAKAFEKEVEKVAKKKDTTLEQAAEELQVKLQPVLAARSAALAEVDCANGDVVVPESTN